MLEEIAVFVQVVRTGSFTKAASKLNLPKSTLSRAVSRLEDSMKVRLLNRTTRSVRLTDAGQRYFLQVAPHIEGLEEATKALEDEQDQPHGLLRITAPVDVGEAVLSELLIRFAARYPRIQIDVDLSPRVVNLAEEGFDVAFRASSRVKDETLVARKIGDAPFYLYASPSYLARKGIPRAIDEISKHECVLFRNIADDNTWTFTDGANVQSVQVQGRIGGNDIPFIRMVIKAGAGIGILPEFIATHDVADGHLVRLLPEWAMRGSGLWFVYKSARHVPKKILALRDFVLENQSFFHTWEVGKKKEKSGSP